MQGVHLRKYGVEATIDFDLYEVDGVDLRVDWTPAAADCEVMKDGGAVTQCTNTATDEGSTYSIVLTATEMEAARLVLKVVDAATKVFLDKVVIIETYGNAAAQHAFDLDTSSVAQGADNNTILSSINIANGAVESDTTYIHGSALTETAGQLAAAFKKFFDVAAPTATALSLPDAVPGATGGAFIAGTNAATTITTALTTAFTGNLTGSVGSVTGAVGSVSGDTKQTADHTASIALILADTNELQVDDYPTSIAAIKTETALIVADTNELQVDDIPAKIAAVQTEVDKIDTVQADLDIITGTSGVLIDTDAVDADALKADAITEIWAKAMSDLAQGVPSATASVLTAINYLYEAWRNKTTTTATLITLMKDDASTGLVKSTISDDATTFTKGEMATGA